MLLLAATASAVLPLAAGQHKTLPATTPLCHRGLRPQGGRGLRWVPAQPPRRNGPPPQCPAGPLTAPGSPVQCPEHLPFGRAAVWAQLPCLPRGAEGCTKLRAAFLPCPPPTSPAQGSAELLEAAEISGSGEITTLPPLVREAVWGKP